MNRLTITFATNHTSAELIETSFSSALVGRTLRCNRSTQHRTKGFEGSFLWSAAIRSLCAVLLKEKIASIPDGGGQGWKLGDGINSDLTSWASSLDYALSKKPHWLIDMFGVDSHGCAVARRVFSRTNTERRRPGPVTVFLNSAFLHPQNIRVVVDGAHYESATELRSLLALIGYNESGSTPGVSPSDVRASSGVHQFTSDLGNERDAFLIPFLLRIGTNRIERRAILDFLHLTSRLKGELKVVGAISGTHEESAADHSFQMVLFAFLMSRHLENGVDTARVIKLCICHELVAAALAATDSPNLSQTAAMPGSFSNVERILQRLSPELAREVRDLWEEFEAGRTLESKCAKALDNLVMQLTHTVDRANSEGPRDLAAVFSQLDHWCAHDRTLQKLSETIKSKAHQKMSTSTAHPHLTSVPKWAAQSEQLSEGS